MKHLVLLIIASFFLQNPAQAAVPSIEREALVALYNSTNGAKWHTSANWLVGDPCSDNWSGVSCDQHENITELRLDRNNLVGTLPGELGNLVSLRRLLFWVNSVSGSIPPEIGNLNQLINLDLRSNMLNGLIPGEIGNLINLQVLRLENNQLTGPIPPELGDLTDLWLLELQDNQLTGSIPSELSFLSKPTSLDLSQNNLTGSIPPELGGMTRLTRIDLSENTLSGLIPPVLGNLVNLRDLDLSGNNLSGPIPLGLASLESLGGLELSRNQLSGSIPPELGNRTQLSQLGLSHNQLSGSIPSSLGRLNNLRELLLNDNQLSGSIPVEFGNLHKLYQLNLSNNQLTGSIPGSLGRTPKQVDIDFSNNQLTGMIPAELGGLRWISSLTLSNNHLVGPIPAELGKLAGLRLNGNRLSGLIPKEFGGKGGGSKFFNPHWNSLFTDDANLNVILDAKSDSDWSSTQTIAPENIQASDIGPESVTLTWNPIEYTADEGSYRVWYGTSSGGPYIDGGITASKSDTSLTISGLDLEQRYYFVVTTETNGHSNNPNRVVSENSREIFVSNLLARPTGIKATKGTYVDVVKVSFNTVEGATVYRVFRCLDRGQTCGAPIGFPKTGSFDDRKAVPGTVYYYRVRACTTSACGKFSVADAGFATIPPDRATVIRATDGVYPDRVHISWDGVEGATVYRVFRCLDTGQTCGSPIGFPHGTSFDDRKGDPDTLYYYRIKACTAQHCSRFSVLNAGHRSDTPSMENSEIKALLLPDQEVPIPTLSEWGRWLLILLTLGFGLVVVETGAIRRKK